MSTNDTPNPEQAAPQGGVLTDLATKAVPQFAILKYWKAIVIAILLVIVGVQSYRVETRNTEIAEFALVRKTFVDEHARMTAEVKKANDALADSNAKIADFTKKNGEILEDFNDFKKDFNTKVQEEAYKRAEKIRREQTPKNCLEAEKFLRDHLGGDR